MTAQELLDFWLEEVGPEGWYRQDAALDARIRERWGGLWEEACRAASRPGRPRRGSASRW